MKQKVKTKKPSMRQVIRKIVREEVAMAIGEVITEIKKPNETIQPIREKKNFSQNSVLNDVLNETANGENEWKTMGGSQFTTERMNELVGGQYGDMMNNNSNEPLSVEGQTPDFLKKDYRAVMKAIDKKQGK